MGELGQWANKNSKFIKIGDGGSVVAEFKGFTESSFRGNPVIEYALKVDGEEKVLTSSSGKFARSMDDISVGDIIKITRTGTGTDTNYQVQIKGDDSGTTPAPTPDPEEVKEKFAGTITNPTTHPTEDPIGWEE